MPDNLYFSEGLVYMESYTPAPLVTFVPPYGTNLGLRQRYARNLRKSSLGRFLLVQKRSRPDVFVRAASLYT